jgi:thioredoxin-related protein
VNAINSTAPPRHTPRHRLRLCAIVLLAVSLGVSAAVVTAQDTAQAGVRFGSLDKAIEQGTNEKQVIAVFFTAQWCVWCQKMKTSTFTDPRVIDASRGFAWAEVDTDVQPHVAAQFQVRGLPVIIFFNARGEMLEVLSGYISPQAMDAKLRELADKADAPGMQRQRLIDVRSAAQKVRLAKSDLERVEAVRALVQSASTQDKTGRAHASAALAEQGDAVWMALTVCMEDAQLSVRAAAADLLAEATGQSIAFDPFAEFDQRAGQVERWRAWIEQQRSDADQPEDQPEDGQLH